MKDGITVIGTGQWGTMLAVMLARRGLPVTLWARTAAEAEELRAGRENRLRLPGVIFPDDLAVSSSLEESLAGCWLLLLVVPAQRMRENVQRLRPYVHKGTAIISAAKGLEMETALRMTQVIKEELPEEHHARIGVLSGPNLAREIAAGLPASTVIAARDPSVAQFVQGLLMSPKFRVYTHDDVIGVELAGALKNIIALGAGAADEFGYGDNAKAAFMTRGLAEMARLGVAAGANPMTFAGLAGLGDLICTCASRHSRNHYVGEELAKGRSWNDIEASMKMVAEGVYTTVAARKLAQKYGVEMPITEAIYQVIFEGKNPRQAVMEMMVRAPKHELEGLEGDQYHSR
ncbi:MAG: NAD(P)H-dependent glycerol-3-phosphate dehydrogenase [Anaerolineae bacterium]